eukprot:3749538-Prymnesium_polylepis.1
MTLAPLAGKNEAEIRLPFAIDSALLLRGATNLNAVRLPQASATTELVWLSAAATARARGRGITVRRGCCVGGGPGQRWCTARWVQDQGLEERHSGTASTPPVCDRVGSGAGEGAC